MMFVKVTSVLVASVVALLAVILGKYTFVLKRWKSVSSLDKNDFAVANFNVHQEREIPTTYYEPGRLGKVLHKWHHGAFHLYRVQPGATFEFNGSQIRSPVVGKKLDSSCMDDPATHDCLKRSTFVFNCMLDFDNTVTEEKMMEAGSILSGESQGYRAAFANMTNKETVKLVWDSLNVPFSLASSMFEHSFISNLEHPVITAPFHANGVTDTMSYQLMGKKTWVFLPPDTFVELMHGTAAASPLFVKRAPPSDSKPEAWVVTTQPGDVLFFPHCWGHAVYTYAGPNLMLSFRKIVPMNFIRQPVIWLSTVIETLLSSFLDVDVANLITATADDNVKRLSKIIPNKKDNLRVQQMYENLCIKEGGILGVDAQLLKILDAEVARNYGISISSV